MNPLKSIPGTIICGIIIAAVIAFAMTGGFNSWSFVVWLHVLAGITWIGLLYYFNFVQVPAAAEAAADTDGPGPAAISRYVAPRALLWFRWGAVATWVTGALALVYLPGGFMGNFFATSGVTAIGIGSWLGTIMLFNVWVLIWPNQKKILGMVSASDDEIATAKNVALLASRTNTMLSIPMVMCMIAAGHGLPF